MPLTARRVACHLAGAFPNRRANPFRRMSIDEFAVRYRGAPVTVADDKARIERSWDARVLEDAPRPAIRASHTGTYLISEQDGQLRADVLAPATTDMASWQWIDGRDGQPAPALPITIRDSRGRVARRARRPPDSDQPQGGAGRRGVSKEPLSGMHLAGPRVRNRALIFEGGGYP